MKNWKLAYKLSFLVALAVAGLLVEVNRRARVRSGATAPNVRLAGTLTGGLLAYRGEDIPKCIVNNMLSVIVDPKALGDARTYYEEEVREMVRWVKASPATGASPARRSSTTASPTSWATACVRRCSIPF